MTERLTDRLIECFNGRNAAGLGEIVADDVTHTAPGSQFGAELKGRRALIQYFGDRVFPKFTTIQFVSDTWFRDPATGIEIAEWHGSFLTQAGVTYVNRGVFVLETAAGRISSMREYFDTERTKQAMSASASGESDASR